MTTHIHSVKVLVQSFHCWERKSPRGMSGYRRPILQTSATDALNRVQILLRVKLVVPQMP